MDSNLCVKAKNLRLIGGIKEENLPLTDLHLIGSYLHTIANDLRLIASNRHFKIGNLHLIVIFI